MKGLNAYCRPQRLLPGATYAAGRDLKLSPLGERIDVLLRLRLLERVLALNLGDQIVLAFEGGDLSVGELAPLLLDFAPHPCSRAGGVWLIACHFILLKF